MENPVLLKEALLYVGTLLIGFEVLKSIQKYMLLICMTPLNFGLSIFTPIFKSQSVKYKVTIKSATNIRKKIAFILKMALTIIWFVAYIAVMAIFIVPLIVACLTIMVAISLITYTDYRLNNIYIFMLKHTRKLYVDATKDRNSKNRYQQSIALKSEAELLRIDKFLSQNPSIPFLAFAGVICITISFILAVK
jgi:hypothetical protein